MCAMGYAFFFWWSPVFFGGAHFLLFAASPSCLSVCIPTSLENCDEDKGGQNKRKCDFDEGDGPPFKEAKRDPKITSAHLLTSKKVLGAELAKMLLLHTETSFVNFRRIFCVLKANKDKTHNASKELQQFFDEACSGNSELLASPEMQNTAKTVRIAAAKRITHVSQKQYRIVTVDCGRGAKMTSTEPVV